MRKLRNFELAHLASWCLDFERAGELYYGMVEEFGGKLDLLGTLGVLEGAILCSEIGDETWWQPGNRRKRQVGLEQLNELLAPPVHLPDSEDRAKRLRSLIDSRRKEILKKLQTHKKRLRDMEVGRSTGGPEREDVRNSAKRVVSDQWFIVSQRLAWFAVGRAYRRDGTVPALNELKNCLATHELVVESADDRFLLTKTGNVAVEVWFDGRISCTTLPEHFDEILPALKLIAIAYDEASL